MVCEDRLASTKDVTYENDHFSFFSLVTLCIYGAG